MHSVEAPKSSAAPTAHPNPYEMPIENDVPMSWEPKWENNDQMVSFLRNFLDLNNKPDAPSAQPCQASPKHKGLSPSSEQSGPFAAPLPEDKPAAYASAFAKLDARRSIKTETLSDHQKPHDDFKVDTLFPLKGSDTTNSKDKKPAPSQFGHDIHFLDPFAFGEPIEDTLSHVPLPAVNAKSKQLHDANVKELDTFSPFVGFSEDFMVRPELIEQLDTIGLARKDVVNVPVQLDSCRKRNSESEESLPPQKRIRTTFAVVDPKPVKQEAVVKSECDILAKEPVKVARTRKNNRERQRRQCLNQKFQELIEVLAPQDRKNMMRVGVGSKGPKWNKHDILSEAIYAIKGLRTRVVSAEARLSAIEGR